MKWYPIRSDRFIWIRYLLIFLFAYAATDKILSPGLFANDLLKARYLDIHVVPWLIWAVPFFEIVVALLLIVNRYTKIGLSVGLCLMSVFTWHLLILWRSNPNSPCSCGGLIDQMSPPVHLTMNLLIMFGILIALFPRGSANKV